MVCVCVLGGEGVWVGSGAGRRRVMPQTDGPRASSCTCRCWHPTASQCLHAIDCCHTQAYEHTLWHNTTHAHTHPTPNGGQRTRTHPSQLSRMRSIAVAAQRRRTVLRRGEHILHVVRERAREHRLLMARLNAADRSAHVYSASNQRYGVLGALYPNKERCRRGRPRAMNREATISRERVCACV